MKNLRNSRHVLWRAISTLTLMVISAVSGGGAVFAIIEGGDFSVVFIFISLLLTFGYLTLAIIQHFNPYRRLALILLIFTNILLLIMPALLIIDAMALNGTEISELVSGLITDLMFSALIFTVAFLLPLWVNWPKKRQPLENEFS